MANFVYDYYVNQILQGNAPWDASDVKVACVSSSYIPSQSGDQFLADISGSYIIRTSGNMAGKTVSGRICDANDLVIYSVTGVVDVDAFVLYYDTGNSATSVLIAYVDTATGLPLTPDGRPVRIVWSNTTNKIFKL